MSTIPQQLAQRRRAELIGATGAGVLGAGVGLLFAEALAGYSLELLLVGLVCHAWGMYQKHRLDSGLGVSTAPWLEWAYWICWVLLAGLATYIVWDLV